MTTQDPCIVCKLQVRPRQEALLCDGCNHWQHRICDSGVTRVEYRAAVRQGEDLRWSCADCKAEITGIPLAESSRISNANASQEVRSSPFTDSELQDALEEHLADDSSGPEAMEEDAPYDAPLPSLGSINVPSDLEESSIEDATPAEINTTFEGPTTYEVIDSGSQKGKKKLADSDGYLYTVKTERKNVHVKRTVSYLQMFEQTTSATSFLPWTR